MDNRLVFWMPAAEFFISYLCQLSLNLRCTAPRKNFPATWTPQVFFKIPGKEGDPPPYFFFYSWLVLPWLSVNRPGVYYYYKESWVVLCWTTATNLALSVDIWDCLFRLSNLSAPTNTRCFSAWIRWGFFFGGGGLGVFVRAIMSISTFMAPK